MTVIIEAVVRSLWSISDGIISGEKMLRDAQEKWSSPPAKTKPQPETNGEISFIITFSYYLTFH